MARDDDTRVIGYFAYTPPMHVICDGDACVIAGSEAGMKRYAEAMVSGLLKGTRIKKTRFGEILKGLELGAAYAFDEEAYNRFHPLCQKGGPAHDAARLLGPISHGHALCPDTARGCHITRSSRRT